MMAKYKVSYSGFVYVEADTSEEAEEKAFDEEEIYSEKQVDAVIEVDEFVVELQDFVIKRGETDMMVNKNSTFCVYMTPCNYCSKFDKPCNEACDDKGKLKEI